MSGPQPETSKSKIQEAIPLKLLFVKLKNIGDALLLTPTLTAVKGAFPNSEIWVAVRKGTEGILAGCPEIDKIVTFAEPHTGDRGAGGLFEDLKSTLHLRKERFDYAFELSDGDRGRWTVALSGAKSQWSGDAYLRRSRWWQAVFRNMHSVPWAGDHRVEKDYNTVAKALPLPSEPPPLKFDRHLSVCPEVLSGMGDFVVFHPVSRWKKKQWPLKQWVQLGRRLLEHTSKILISAGPDPVERRLAAELADALGGQRAVSTDGKLAWAELAACLYEARLFVGIDTAATHLAAACQCPIVAIFYPQCVVSQWRPWKAPHELLHASVLDGSAGSSAMMADISPDLACEAALRIMLSPQQRSLSCRANDHCHPPVS